jgi:hypothetical protein
MFIVNNLKALYIERLKNASYGLLGGLWLNMSGTTFTKYSLAKKKPQKEYIPNGVVFKEKKTKCFPLA